MSLVRTLALMLGAGDWSEGLTADSGSTTVGVAGAASRPGERIAAAATTAPSTTLTQRVVSGISSLALNTVRSTYLALVAAPECKSTVAVARLTALADGISPRLPGASARCSVSADQVVLNSHVSNFLATNTN